ncbi:MAG TPA: sugar phosphate isomerase/epimerase family protein [Mobilitalea sp.]|nr:sugar phosphate isomerase/epimerase family protein [Mobilitalea sp.]
MQIGIRLHDTNAPTLEERLKITKEQGFTCVHVALYKVMDEFSVSSGTLTPGLAMYLRRLFQDYNIDIAVIGCYLNLANPDQEQLNNIINTYLAYIRFASILECGVVGTETGAPNILYEFEPACHTEEALRKLIYNLSIIVSYAEKMGVIIAIEPVRSHIVYNPEIARRVLNEIKSPNLQIIFDPVNLLGMDNFMRQTQVMEEAIDLLGDDIAVIHMKDFIIRDNKMVNVAAGTGNLNYSPIIDFIKEKKPMIHCTLEDTNQENVMTAKDYIMTLWNKSNGRDKSLYS